MLSPETVVGDTAVGDTAVGDTAVGGTVVGDTVVGDTVVGNTVSLGTIGILTVPVIFNNLLSSSTFSSFDSVLSKEMRFFTFSSIFWESFKVVKEVFLLTSTLDVSSYPLVFILFEN